MATKQERAEIAEKKRAALQLKKDEAKTQRDAVKRNAPLPVDKPIIDIELLTVGEDDESPERITLKKVYASYYKQNPHRIDDELEKGQLLEKLNRLS